MALTLDDTDIAVVKVGKKGEKSQSGTGDIKSESRLKRPWKELCLCQELNWSHPTSGLRERNRSMGNTKLEWPNSPSEPWLIDSRT